jgi:N-acetylmuramoyl-L-alanine amidase
MKSDPIIAALQADLATLGYKPGPIDGLMGPKTRGALWAFAVDQSVDPADPALAARARELAAALRPGAPPLPEGYLDLVDRCTLKAWRRCVLCREGAAKCAHMGGPLPRRWADIDTIVLHQWGAPAVDAPERHLSLKAHYSITRRGDIYRIHPETAFGWHAQGLSQGGIGVEFVGLFRGVKGDPKTRPGAPASWVTQNPTEAQLAAGLRLGRYLVAKVAHEGGRIRHVFAHRQGAPRDSAKHARPACPGEEIWRGVALPLMAELGLDDGGPGYTTGKGLPLPDAWTGRGDGVKY